MGAKKVVAAVSVAGAMLAGATTPAAAAEQAKVMTTNDGSFMEINQQGKLVRWTRSGSTFSGQERGSDWGQTATITSLDANSFLEIKADRLARWVWNGSTYIKTDIGSGWSNARLIAGITANRFLEVNLQNELVLWQFNQLMQFTRTVLKPAAPAWSSSRLIAGKGNINFMEIKNSGEVTEWYNFGFGPTNTVESIPISEVTGSDIRLTAGLDLDHFLTIDQPAGDLWEFTLDPEQGYVKAQRGTGWSNARLIG